MAVSADGNELHREFDRGVVRLTLNRPGRLNALSEALLGELEGALARVAKDAAVRVVVIGAADR